MRETTKHNQSFRAPREAQPVESQVPDTAGLMGLFDEWMNGDELEQRETFDALRRLLDEDRPDGYKLFS